MMTKSQTVPLFKSPNYEMSSFTRMLKITGEKKQKTFYISLGHFAKAKHDSLPSICAFNKVKCDED